MEIFLSINNREQVIQLPILPEEITIQSPHNNEKYNTISQGDINLIGTRGLKTINIKSFFPKQEMTISRNNQYFGWDYPEIIESWIDRRIPIRITVTGINKPVSMAVTIDSFEYGTDSSGDVFYSLALTEFKFVNIQQGG